MGAIIIDRIPEDLRNRFKSECYRRGLHIRDVIIRLMELELDKHFSSVINPKEKKN